MIEPGDKFTIEHEGKLIEVECLTRSQQRKVIGVLNKLSTLEETIESVEKVYDMADELLTLCVPGLTDDQRERMSNEDAFSIAGKVLAGHSLDEDTKKKSVSQHSLERANSAEVALPDVFVATT